MGIFERELLERKSCYIDVVLVIDSTGSMDTVIDRVKKGALNFYFKCVNSSFVTEMSKCGMDFSQVRIKVICFRDYKYDGPYAMKESRFYVLPDEVEAFQSFLNDMEGKGGGDNQECACEALALAMRSDWTNEGDKRRHVILLLTDSPACELGDIGRVSSEYYPPNMPSNISELHSMWNGLGGQELSGMPDQRAKRMLIFAPPHSNLEFVYADYWDKVYLEETSFSDDIIDPDMLLQFMYCAID